MIFVGLGASWADLANKVEKVAKRYALLFPFGGPFPTIIAKMWASKNSLVFSDPAFSAENLPRPPNVSIIADLGPKKHPKWKPKL